jgi:UDP-glucose 4-epimerase
MKIAVTGGAGFIGSHVVDRLHDAGHTVIVVDMKPPHRPDVAFRHADLSDLGSMVEATRGCDVVFHLAAVSNVNDAFDHPVATVRINITGTVNVFEACRRNGVQRAVLASTVWVYAGATGEGPHDEEAPFHLPSAGHIYSSSKIAGELIAHNYNELYDQPFTILRYGIPFGPRMRPELVIPKFVQMALDGKPITVNGDGSQFRNYVYVEDLADAHVLALAEAGKNEVFNLEGPRPITIRHLTETIRDLLDIPMAVEFGATRPGDYEGKEVSAEKAGRVLGWNPETTFEEGMRRYVEWYLADIEATKIAEAAEA